MLHLAVGVDLVLQRRQIASALLHFSQGEESGRAQGDEKQFDQQEGGEQLGSNGRRNAAYIFDQRVPSSHRRPHWRRLSASFRATLQGIIRARASPRARIANRRPHRESYLESI